MNRFPKCPHSWSRRYIFWHGSSIFLGVYSGKTWFAVERWSIWRCVFDLIKYEFLNIAMLNCPSLVHWTVSRDEVCLGFFSPLFFNEVSLVWCSKLFLVLFAEIGDFRKDWYWGSDTEQIRWWKNSMCETPAEPESSKHNLAEGYAYRNLRIGWMFALNGSPI